VWRARERIEQGKWLLRKGNEGCRLIEGCSR
jgi:hypothetical protein